MICERCKLEFTEDYKTGKSKWKTCPRFCSKKCAYTLSADRFNDLQLAYQKHVEQTRKKIEPFNCQKCNKYCIEDYRKSYNKNPPIFCSRVCANSRLLSDETKNKIKLSTTKSKNSITLVVRKAKFKPKIIRLKVIDLSKIKLRELIKCLNCDNKIKRRKTSTGFCKSCYYKSDISRKIAIQSGIKSSQSQNRRSKNEIYFGELCQKEFKEGVEYNQALFNGWDADIILTKQKIAILWNGNWHHKKITKKHSLKQVQNRDKIKVGEIIKAGYTPYIINDYGKYNPKFVEQEFEKFWEWSKSSLLVS